MKSGKGFIFASTLALITASASAFADTATDVDCVKCVNTRDLAGGAVSTWKLKKGAVTENRISENAVSWEKLALELQARIVDLETELAALQDQVNDNTVLKLDGYLDLDTSDSSKPVARFAGVNVQIVNGNGNSYSVNGLGNLIVGYDEGFTEVVGRDFPVCSDGQWVTQEDCELNGEVWAMQHKSGSHNVVIGWGHRYSKGGGLLAGADNTVNADGASVTGGGHNIASAPGASVSGGHRNHAAAFASSISGGQQNRTDAAALMSSISGGRRNTTLADNAHVSGGQLNIARKQYSAVVGGQLNAAWGKWSVVTGGGANKARGDWSVVSGGQNKEALGPYDWVAGD